MSNKPDSKVETPQPTQATRYPAYRESGVEWLPEIPAHWELQRLKRIVQFRGGGTPAKDNLEYWTGVIPWVSPKDMKTSLVTNTEDSISVEAVRESATSMIPAGAVLMVVRSGILAHTIPVAIAGCELTLNQDMKAMIPDSRITPEYLLYFISGMQRELLARWKKEGATVESLELDAIGSTTILLPPVREQRAIATYLGNETAKIDAMGAKKEHLIDQLHELRTAVISRAVTKGLSPTVPVKNSGIDWLGIMPAHWELAPLKRLLTRTDYGISDSLAAGGSIRVLTMAHIQRGEVVMPADGSIDVVEDALLLDHSDLLFNRTNSRELVGKVGIFRGSRSDSVTFASYLVRMTVQAGVSPEWLNYLLNSSGLLEMARSMAFLSVNQSNLNPTRYAQIVIPIPPPAEQAALAEHLRKETARIDRLVAKIREAIDQLKSLRTAVIYSAVTGKIDLRNESS